MVGSLYKDYNNQNEYECGVDGYTGSWKVLGAENGKLLIMSTVDVGKLTLSGKDGYNNGISQLNAMCAPYGKNARSIKVEDINRVTGYDPNKTGDGKKFEEDGWSEYGNIVTYTAGGSSAANGKIYEGNLSNNKYEHPDGRKLGTNNVNSITVKSTYYYYYPYSLTKDNSTTGTCKGIATDSLAYKLLLRKADDSENCSYWLASSYVGAGDLISGFSLCYVHPDGVVGSYGIDYDLWLSDGTSASPSLGVRAVVPVD